MKFSAIRKKNVPKASCLRFCKVRYFSGRDLNGRVGETYLAVILTGALKNRRKSPI